MSSVRRGVERLHQLPPPPISEGGIQTSVRQAVEHLHCYTALAMLADFAILLYLIEQGGWLSTIFTPILSGGLLFAMGLLIVVYCRFIA